MLETITGILLILWFIGMIASFTLSGSIHMLVVIASMLLLVTAFIVIQINKRKESN